MNLNQIPNHVAIIMDGNGRWAQQRKRPRVFGHQEGVQTIRKITEHASQLGIKVLSVYAFSTENWERPKKEVEFLMRLPIDFFDEYLEDLMSINVKIHLMGEIDGLPNKTKKIIEKALLETKDNQGMILNIGLNYSGQAEIVRAANQFYQENPQQEITIDGLNRYLYTYELGEYQYPDLVIRTSGEERLSNFMLWQVAYSELYFTSILWPDFTTEAFDAAIEDFSKRHRRFGKV